MLHIYFFLSNKYGITFLPNVITFLYSSLFAISSGSGLLVCSASLIISLIRSSSLVINSFLTAHFFQSVILSSASIESLLTSYPTISLNATIQNITVLLSSSLIINGIDFLPYLDSFLKFGLSKIIFGSDFHLQSLFISLIKPGIIMVLISFSIFIGKLNGLNILDSLSSISISIASSLTFSINPIFTFSPQLSNLTQLISSNRLLIVMVLTLLKKNSLGVG